MNDNYNARQIKLMKERISEYRDGKIRVDKLLNDLEALLDCLENVSESWKDDFLEAWGIIEVVYASALYNEKKILSDDDMKEIYKGLKDIEDLIQIIEEKSNGNDH